jgi:predicted short-subunit dehydrogenase-like oxidoreductase (DUF2520 family)
MRAWSDDPEPEGGGATDSRGTLAAIEAAGIDLDPVPAGHHRHGDETHPDDHVHPHAHSEPGERPVTGVIGAGHVGTALGLALHRAGWPIAAVASRDAGRRKRFSALVPGVRPFAEASAVLDDVELVIVAVPDDAVAPLAASLRLYSGQAMVHTSGVLSADVLAPAMAAGTQVGSFHPLVAFVDVERSVRALEGATVAIEGDDQLAGLLAEMAEAIGSIPVRLAPGTKAAYHAAASLAAGGVVALLDTIAELGRVAGLDERGAMTIYGRLVEQTLGNARDLGIRAALAGPVARGDVGTVRAHLAVVAGEAPAALELYRALIGREIDLAVARGDLSDDGARRLRTEVARRA